MSLPVESSALKVVALGGGTGLSTILRGLKRHVPTVDAPPEDPGPVIGHLTAVVTVTDDGGSSGRLRREFGVIPPGDIRNCMIAVSDDSDLLSQLFQYRFSAGEGLEGHSFGNLFLTALADVTGDFTEAIKLSSVILKTRGDIVPATTANVQVEAEMDDGTRVRGETNITASKRRVVKLRMNPPNPEPLPNTLKAIAEADLITIGPGSLFTSLVTNLLVKGVAEALIRSRAVKVYICNLMTQANESLDLTASQHVKALFDHAGGKIFDYALLNGMAVPADVRERYAAENASPIVNDVDAVRALGVEPLVGEYLHLGDKLRHDYVRVTRDLLHLATSVKRPGQATMFADASKT